MAGDAWLSRLQENIGWLLYIEQISLVNKLPIEEGARLANRLRPPLIVSVPIVLTTDFGKVREIAHASVAGSSRCMKPYRMRS